MKPPAGHSTVNEHHVPDWAHPTSHHSTVNEHHVPHWAHPTSHHSTVNEHQVPDWEHPTAGHSTAIGHSTHFSTRQPCDAVGECPRGVAKLLPHRTDCSLFCQCDHGVPVTARCPAGLEFNAALQVCDYPHRAGCSCSRSGAHHRTHH
ncbi:uncharacterized protein LOC126356056 [Schistocerca gregaria]|uniref:uncharacterized protein LOC126356056 n=1 Tax=Schistocerca gregaria TaxID=7010 RepID=UPI00211DEA7C|nr:uncharacterized protein LOC126356056 [Schistocerca gregaria]